MSETKHVIHTKRKTLTSFSPDSVIAYQDHFDREISTLKAMVELICHADMESFSNSGELRWGLEQMFELFWEKQESRVKALYNAAINSPEYILQRAQWVCEGFKTDGDFHSDTVLESLKDIDLVIDTFGDKTYGQAAELKDRLLTIANSKKMRIPA